MKYYPNLVNFAIKCWSASVHLSVNCTHKIKPSMHVENVIFQSIDFKQRSRGLEIVKLDLILLYKIIEYTCPP